MSINKILSKDELYNILSKVEIARWKKDDYSTLNNLLKCAACHLELKACNHLHPDEINGVILLKSVCALWNEIINKRFAFEPFSQPTLQSLEK